MFGRRMEIMKVLFSEFLTGVLSLWVLLMVLTVKKDWNLCIGPVEIVIKFLEKASIFILFKDRASIGLGTNRFAADFWC